MDVASSDRLAVVRSATQQFVEAVRLSSFVAVAVLMRKLEISRVNQ